MRAHLIACAVSIAVSALVPVRQASAADLVIAMQGEQTAIDPHWMTSPRNWTINHHIFEPLIRRDNDTGAIAPWLASSWKRLDDTTWEFYLRRDVKWHDGTSFTAEDVLYTYDRVTHVPGAPNPFTGYVKYFDRVTAPDPYTVRIVTKGPAPAMLLDIAYLLIVSKKIGETATTADYNSGKAAIGTGAYTFASFLPNDRTVLKSNPNYWGEKEPWDTVTFRMIHNDASRTAALLAGDVDVIESVPTTDVERLKSDKRVTLYSKPTGRVVFMGLNVTDDVLSSGRITAIDGTPLKTNPFTDKRVREALKLAVDPNQMVERIYQGEAIATGQYLLPGVFGYLQDITAWKADPARARKLLEESGWADKFKVSIGVSETTFQNAVKASQAIAQAWTRLGVPTDVSAMPYPVYLNELRGSKFPVTLGQRQNSPLVADAFYPIVIHTRTGTSGGGDDEGLGTSNFARYSNPAVDKLIESAMVTMDDAAREKMYRDAGRIAIEDAQVSPLFLLNEATATKTNLSFIARFDRAIYAMNVRPRK